MSYKLNDFVSTHYPNSKADLFAAFIEKGNRTMNTYGFNSMVTMQSWMFLSSFEEMRKQEIILHTLSNLMHMNNMVMHIAFGTAVAIFRNPYIPGYRGTYNQVNIADVIDDESGERPREFPVNGNEFSQTSTKNFSKIPGSPIAYWVSDSLLKCYDQKNIYDYAKPCKGIDTGDNSIFLRLWYEIKAAKMFIPNENKVGKNDVFVYKWFPYNKGGNYRKWYGNNDYVLNWEDDGYSLKRFSKSNLRNKDRYFDKGITWSTVTSGSSSFRYFTYGFLFDNGGSCLFAEKNLLYIQGMLNSCVSTDLLKIQPTVNTQPGTIGSLPLIICEEKESIEQNVYQNISLSKSDWDSFETSWDFKRHPLVVDPKWREDQLTYNFNAKTRHDEVSLISVRFDRWKDKCERRFTQLKSNEEELNRIFIDIYELQDELTPEEEDKDVTVRKADLTREIKSLISYAVGCMFGRYSLDTEGLAYAGGEWDSSKYKTYIPDSDNILPITDDEYFEDDIVSRFINFIKVVYGEDTLEENLKFISDALGGKGSPREVIRNYFLNDFFKDHCNTYQVTGSGKRPIYWQFDSGKKNGFKALMYIHRYTPDLIARMRTSYIHELQSKYNSQISLLEGQIDSATSTSDRVKLEKQLKKIKDQADELRVYEEKIHHYADMMMPMDLDDGVKVNYAKFEELLTKIK